MFYYLENRVSEVIYENNSRENVNSKNKIYSANLLILINNLT